MQHLIEKLQYIDARLSKEGFSENGECRSILAQVVTELHQTTVLEKVKVSHKAEGNKLIIELSA